MFQDERPGRLRQNPLVRNPIKRCWRAWGNGVIALTANAMEGMREIGDMPDRADAPVIMLTAIEDKNSVPEGIVLGIRDYILKPFAPDDLLNRIRRVLDAPRSGEPQEDVLAGAKYKVAACCRSGEDAIEQWAAQGYGPRRPNPAAWPHLSTTMCSAFTPNSRSATSCRSSC